MKDKKEIEEALIKLDRREVVAFARRWALRALPFLGHTGNFDYWEKSNRLKYLYSVFNAIDFSYATAAYAYAYAYSYAHNTAVYASAEIALAADTATADAYAAAYAATATVYDAYDAVDSHAAAAAAYAYNSYVFIHKIKGKANINKFADLISAELHALKAGDPLPPFPIEIYGEVWSNFQTALGLERCEYWGHLYQTVFENQFEMDQDELKKRLEVPREIKEQGAAAVAHYLEAAEQVGLKRLNEARIIVLGDKGAGKTCISRRLINPEAEMTQGYESTAGVDTTLWKLLDQDIQIRIWDFAGHTVTHAAHQFFLSERCIYLIVYDGRSEERNRLSYWLDHMKNYGGDSQAIILVNQRDKHSAKVAINRLKEKYPIKACYTFSIRDDRKDLDKFREEIIAHIQRSLSWEKQAIPRNYFEVKEALEALFASGGTDGASKDYIEKNVFDEIAKKFEVRDAAILLNGLHNLGVSLWYEQMQSYSTLVLNPEWISHGVYTIINWVSEQNNYVLSLKDFSAVFSSEDDRHRYPKDKHGFLFDLLIHYELAYEIHKGRKLIIPYLLEDDQPEKLPDFPVGESLMIRYEAEQPLPPDTISRFIVRHNQEICIKQRKPVAWRYGVVLKDDQGDLALVREDDRCLSVSVKGRNQTEFISRLRESLNAIFARYKSERPSLKYRIEHYGPIQDSIGGPEELWLGEQNIVKHDENNRSYYDSATDQDIPMGPTVKNYQITTNNIQATSVMLGGQGNQQIRNEFNFKDCSLSLQGQLNDLSGLLSDQGDTENAAELAQSAQVLDAIDTSAPPDREQIRKTGALNRIKRVIDEIADEESSLHKNITKLKHGVGIAQDIAEKYNSVAQWAGLPQVPKPFLK